MLAWEIARDRHIIKVKVKAKLALPHTEHRWGAHLPVVAV